MIISGLEATMVLWYLESNFRLQISERKESKIYHQISTCLCMATCIFSFAQYYCHEAVALKMIKVAEINTSIRAMGGDSNLLCE